MDAPTIALIDEVVLRRGFVKAALQSANMGVCEFDTAADCLQAEAAAADVLLYAPSTQQIMQILQAVKCLNERFKLPVVVVTHAEPRRELNAIRELLRGGAKGYLPSSSIDFPTAIAALRFVADGGTYAPPEFLAAKPKYEKVNRAFLTRRQLQVLEELREGHQNKIIAFNLGMTESTVKVHIRNIMRKVGARNRTEAVYRSNLVEIQPIADAA